MGQSRIRALGLAVLVAATLLVATGQLRWGHGHAPYGGYRAQVDALLDGRLALTDAPEGLAHDLAWTPTGVQQVWGLGVPLWQLPFEAGARAVGLGPFPDRIAMLAWLALMVFVLVRAFRPGDGESRWIAIGSVFVAAALPGLVTMMRGRIGVYEEAAIYAYGAAMVVLGGLVSLVRRPTRTRFLLLLVAAGLTGLVRPTVWFYGLATAILASAIWIQHHGRRALPTLALGASLFAIGGGLLFATNARRFGSGTEFGHRLNLHSLPGNLVATRFSYPFERVGWIEASEELIGSLFDRPEQRASRAFYDKGLHRGQSSTVRWREYYFTTFSWPYVPLLAAGLVLGVRAWRRRQPAARDPLARWMFAWGALGGLPLFVFYLHAPSLSSRYQLDLAPALVTLLLIVWRAFTLRLQAHHRVPIAFAMLMALWTLAIVTSKTRGPSPGNFPGRTVDRTMAAFITDRISHPVSYDRAPTNRHELGDPAPHVGSSASHPAPPPLYLDGFGWDLTTGDVPPATYFYVTDPSYVELEIRSAPRLADRIIDWNHAARVTVGLQHLGLVATTVTATGARLRFEPAHDRPLAPGLHVAFLAFGPDTELDQPRSAFQLIRIQWRD